MAVAIIARECVEKFGDLKPAEAVIGTGPWVLEGYRPRRLHVRPPSAYFGWPACQHRPHRGDGGRDNASRTASFLAGKYDLGWENPGIITAADWLQIKDTLQEQAPGLRSHRVPRNVGNHLSMPWIRSRSVDLRVRHDVHALDRKALIDALYEGVGIANPPGCRPRCESGHCPSPSSAKGAKNFGYDPKEAGACCRPPAIRTGSPATFAGPRTARRSSWTTRSSSSST